MVGATLSGFHKAVNGLVVEVRLETSSITLVSIPGEAAVLGLFL